VHFILFLLLFGRIVAVDASNPYHVYFWTVMMTMMMMMIMMVLIHFRK